MPLLRADAVRAAVKRALQQHDRRGFSADVDGVVAAVALHEGIELTVREADLPPGSFGRWLRYRDGREVFEVAHCLPSRDWTIAHELGHLMLRHYEDAPLQRGCHAVDERSEHDAERFASLLTSRLELVRRAPRDAVFL